MRWKGVPQYEKESGSSITFLIFYSCDEHERFFNIWGGRRENFFRRFRRTGNVSVWKIFRIECDGIDIDFITTPKGEPDKRYDTQYAVFDCDGNGEAELHVQSARYYYIFQYKNGALQLYKNLSPYPHYYALKNGAFISHDFGAGPLSDEYRYYIFDTYGNETFSIGFTKYDKNFNGEYDEGDEYVFDNVEVTKDIWEKLTERFLYIDEDGIERIKNEIEWTDLTV